MYQALISSYHIVQWYIALSKNYHSQPLPHAFMSLPFKYCNTSFVDNIAHEPQKVYFQFPKNANMTYCKVNQFGDHSTTVMSNSVLVT